MTQMQFTSGISYDKNPDSAVKSVLRQVSTTLKGEPADLAVLFISSLYQTGWTGPIQTIREKLGQPLLIGCTGGGILGKDKEMEFVPALSLVAARLPEVKLHPFVVTPEDLAEPKGPGFWIEKLGCPPQKEPVGILLPDPFTCNTAGLIGVLNAVYPKTPIIGGLASSADPQERSAIFMNGEVIPEGAVGLLLSGNIMLQTIVSQGCRPVGRSYIITKAENNIILELAGMPATEALRQLFETLPDPDKKLAQTALLLGVVMDEHKENFKRGDFLIRNLIGMDPETGALVVGDQIRVGQTVQFQVRDAAASKEDLSALLKEHSSQLKTTPPSGALLFSCMGRGKDLYGEPHYDIKTIQSAIGNCAIGGFFCNGEIGPVGEQIFVHGFTSSLGLFRPKT